MDAADRTKPKDDSARCSKRSSYAAPFKIQVCVPYVKPPPPCFGSVFINNSKHLRVVWRHGNVYDVGSET